MRWFREFSEFDYLRECDMKVEPKVRVALSAHNSIMLIAGHPNGKRVSMLRKLLHVISKHPGPGHQLSVCGLQECGW